MTCDFCGKNPRIGWIIDAKNYHEASRKLDNETLKENECFEFCADCGLGSDVIDLEENGWISIIR